MDHIAYDERINHIVYPLLDGKQEDIAIFFDNFYEIVQANILKGSVLVHCAAGVSRVFILLSRAPPLSFPIL
jgi:protein-tyrosine phosphatase